MNARHTKAVLIVCAVALVTAACGGPKEQDLQLGVKRVALNLAFSDDAKAKDVTPRKVVETLIVEEGLGDADLVPRPKPRPAAQRQPECPTAAPGTFPKEPVPLFPRGAPKAGLYRMHSTGTVRVTVPYPLRLPYPARSTMEIRDVVVTPGDAARDALPREVQAVLGSGTIVSFEKVRRVATAIITERWSYDDARLVLVERVVVNGKERSEFKPSIPVTFLEFGTGEGDDWSSIGVDTEHNTAMVVQGTIEKREYVDLCGKVVDALKVLSTETIIDTVTGEQSGTDPQQPNVYRFATQHGVLQLVDEGHFTQVTQVEGIQVVAEYDYTSTLDSVEPLIPAKGT